ncbi:MULTISPECIES: hypothetical protein [unclassified Mesorhizobium]|uniref:hypothetical protein n=1 Tax=unclassified Mesorhizobium TaxID=325217 RepID=UPI000FDC3028|nr:MULTISPECIES: hypothetical protein [unclassified Mesorhizobium]TGQ12334.1 hypothetical protein EN862_015715 [Mesorhizobium sp. M2E.F.Ca.ET.219.01.1.1]TGT68155.1 hypothetical protein EN809_026985 [Mesorhizobium sp. M2E.F.Ca.ET.166.01.1.1]TGW01159.1 hypothetical protein EN797_012295 [Mesorhizobium sp. M2E.F.Ca.ET.154.01.1.1]
MTAAELQQAAKALAAMFSCFPQSALADAEMQLRGYLAAVQDAELQDVEAAIRRFIRGEAKVDNAQFCPSSAQLSIEVRERRLMRELTAKRASLGASSSPPQRGGEVARRSRDGEGSALREAKAG